jgi:hypothetical protein
VAAAGLAFGRPDDSSPERPSARKRKAGDTVDLDIRGQDALLLRSRPGTSSTAFYSDNGQFPVPPLPSTTQPLPQTRPSNARVDIINGGVGRTLSNVWRGDFASFREHIGEDVARESVSSRGSWIRRLSTMPSPQNNSPRSSMGPDSPSVSLSHGSAAPILSNQGSSPAQLPPNKLVKRSTSGNIGTRRSSRPSPSSHVPTLRRPATSHQRSMTLQQQFREHSLDRKEESQTPASQIVRSQPSSNSSSPEVKTLWRPFFQLKITKLTKERSSGSADSGTHNFSSTSRRVLPDVSVKPTLLKPGSITSTDTSHTASYDEDSISNGDEVSNEAEKNDGSTPSGYFEGPQKRARSLSTQFSSPGSWGPRTGSLRISKRNVDGRGGDVRYPSAPLPQRNIASAHDVINHGHRAITDPTLFLPHKEISTATPLIFQGRSRNSSSPLPPLSRLSSFNLDIARLGLSSSSSSALRQSPNTPDLPINTTSTSIVSSPAPMSPNSPAYLGTLNSKLPRTFEAADRASTLVGSDTDGKGFTFSDDEDVDFQSETVFDSLRSGATGSVRSNNGQLDSMFDESPPSVASKGKRLSVHELLGNGIWQEGSNKIVEEDEGMSTPIREKRISQEDSLQTPVRNITADADIGVPSSLPSFSMVNKDFGQLSLDDDDDDDEDWTRDDMDENEKFEHNSQLSPPSSSLNSRRVNPNIRTALADVTHSGSPNGHSGINADRPKSNLFDWSEPSGEKLDYLGNSPRPKTAHVKHLADGRGGRTNGRRGPSALHIRSQSVPVVPDVAGQRDSKLAPKFGTWGLGAKGVSEEWDGDFDFESNADDDSDDGENKLENSGMFVPLAIQASQENVVGHVGQIREVCLLVEDLKRLRLLAREKGLLDGSSAPLWKEAEGIIALAVPEEEDLTLSSPGSPASIAFHPDVAEDKYQDQGPDIDDVSTSEAPFEVFDRHGRPTGFIYDGSTVRRRSVFSPGDDIFGARVATNNLAVPDSLQLPSNLLHYPRLSSDYARSVMEIMHQHRSTSDPLIAESEDSKKMPFDTTSLRDLVHRASVLSRTLADLIRKSDGSESPEASPHRELSPAFTRVFTDPMSSPPKHLPRSQSNNSLLSGSIDSSPTRSLGQRMHMMTVI